MTTMYDERARARTGRVGSSRQSPHDVESPGSVLWLEEALSHEPVLRFAPLTQRVETDVCVVGGGFTGLWTAIEIREQSPTTRVVLIESEQCGFGASGRNGGWATGWHDELDGLITKFGEIEALRLAARSSWAIDRIESFCTEYGIDCHFRRRGALWTASAPWQIGGWQPAVAACTRFGRANYLETLTPSDVRERTGSPMALAGVRQTDAASIQPALLVRGMRRVAHELGVAIYEGTAMTGLDRHRPAVVRTTAGEVVATTVPSDHPDRQPHRRYRANRRSARWARMGIGGALGRFTFNGPLRPSNDGRSDCLWSRRRGTRSVRSSPRSSLSRSAHVG
jgi:hypothetical protein